MGEIVFKKGECVKFENVVYIFEKYNSYLKKNCVLRYGNGNYVVAPCEFVKVLSISELMLSDTKIKPEVGDTVDFIDGLKGSWSFRKQTKYEIIEIDHNSTIWPVHIKGDSHFDEWPHCKTIRLIKSYENDIHQKSFSGSFFYDFSLLFKK